MASFLYSLLFFFFFFFFFSPFLTCSLASSPPPSPSSLIQSTCSLTSNYDFCVATLQSDPHSLKANDVRSLSTIAVKMASATAKSTSKYASAQAKNATEAAAVRSGFRTCAEKYGNAGEALRSALDSLAGENYDYAYVHVSAAQEYASACGRLFQRSSGVGYPDAMAEREADLKRLCGTALDIISQLGLKMSESSRSPPRDRKIRTERVSYRDAPYRRDFRRGSRHIAAECTTKALCWNCKEPGHVASNCPNEGI
ncbi:hypothetical protein B296_00057137 [Ensete ventricosum]|uniref:CCHC-type domain-containing protein n=1 Tax=Ensete ventricosum TaxID=4639 RepID=A0A426X5S0_ENSVE|nr:hypothetical protein B296_00057137 [Ensete ventricosum]